MPSAHEAESAANKTAPPTAAMPTVAKPKDVSTTRPSRASDGQPPAPAWIDPIGRLHPLLVHVPIGWIALLVLVEIATLLFGSSFWKRAGYLLVIASAMSMMPAVATGLVRYATHGPSDEELLIVQHRNWMIAAFVALLGALVVRIWRRNELAGAPRLLYLLLLVTAVGLLTMGGHLGARVVYGPDYLPL